VSNASRVTVDFMAANARKMQVEELQLRTNGLEVLVAILRSLGASINLQSSSSGQRIVLDEVKSGKSVTETQKPLENSLSSPSSNADDDNLPFNIVETFDKKLKNQEEIEMGILRFNLSPMKGLKYLNSHGHLEFTPKAVSQFLIQYQDKLDKTAVGDLLGREKEYENGFCYHVLGEYVDSMDFSRMAFDQAIRYFLYGFRLPGEAQKIDRIMEKFAERYYLQHKDQFASADMAFILAFSTIMLQTNLHNPAIKDDKRMTKEQFIKQNKGISADGELSDELLASIYDHIAAEPISFAPDVKKSKKDDNAFVVFQSLSDRKKKDAFNMERKEMVRVGEALIRQSKKRNSTFVTKVATNDESYVKPMFEIVWPPVVGVLSHLLESFDDARIIELSILAIQFAIGLSCRLDCAIARNTFVNAVAKFTSLDTVKEMKHKNILCIKLILSIALTDGDYLDESWTQVLQCISMLSRLQTLTNNLQNDEIYLSELNTVVGNDGSRLSKKSLKSYGDRYNMNSSISDPFSKLFVGPSKAETNRLLEEANAELISKDIDPVLIDKIFLNSVNLSTQSVIHFVRSLCEVSMLEISTSNTVSIIRGRENYYDLHIPRTFSLQKIVEVADYNMNTRLRMEWTSIWKLLEEHFTSVGLHDNKALAMYAIDSLKQLSIKFLQKDELSNFNFQRLFLKPFESIIAGTMSLEIRDLVLRCIDIMIKACATNIRSGWKTIFSIVGIAAAQSSADVASIAFDIMERLMKNNFDLLVNDFVELLNCLAAFVSSGHTQLSLRALPHMEVCSDYLARTTVPTIDKRVSDEFENENVEMVEQQAVFRFWWPLFLALSTRVSDVRAQVRIQSLEILRSILFKHGQIFSSQTWGVIFKGVLFPIIDSAKVDCSQGNSSEKSADNQSWVGSMAYLVLRSYSDLYLCFKHKDSDLVLLSDILFVFENCVCNEVKLLSTTALQVLRQLIFSLGQQSSCVEKTLDPRHINMILSILRNCVLRNMVFNYEGMGSLSISHEQIPVEIQSAFNGRARSNQNSGTVITPYGTGFVVQVD
jgi:brefeldin A-inhibited guanine nucleotide-exchange protein